MSKVKYMICGKEYKWLSTHIKTHDISCTKQLSIDDMENMRRWSKLGP